MELLPLLGAILYVVGWLWTVVIAFKESPLWGIGCFLFPIVWIYYVATRWQETRPCFLLALLGAVTFFASGGTIPG